MKLKLYGLKVKKTGKLACVECEGNGDADFCNSYQAKLTEDGMPWLTNDREHAERVLTDIGWYNSGLDTPTLGFLTIRSLEIVEVELEY